MDSHVRGLLKGLAAIDRDNQYFLFSTHANHDSFEVLPVRCERVLLRAAHHTVASRLLSEQFRLAGRISRYRLDVLHSPGFTMPLWTKVPRVFTVHDLKVYAMPGIYSASRRILRKYLTREAVRRADAIISVSNFTKQEIIKQFGVSEHVISVIHNAADSPPPVVDRCWSEVAQRLGIRDEYIVVFSSREPHKNVPTLLRAFAQSGIPNHVQLVVVGHLPESSLPPLASLADGLGIGQRILFTGYLTELHRNLVLAHAKLLAVPSLYEGFGIVLLEAMNAGVPIACADAAALPEVAGPAAVFFDPLAVDEVASALQRVLVDGPLRERLIVRGRRRVRDFSWEKSARQTLEVYEQVACKPHTH